MAAVCFAVLVAQSGSTSDMELSLNEYGSKCRMVKVLLLFPRAGAAQDVATATAGRGATPPGAVRGHVGAAREQQQRGPEPAALLGRHAGEEARSLLRNAGWPQASAVFSKEVLTFVCLRVRQARAFLLLGVVVGNEGELPCWGFEKYIRRQQGAGSKDTSLPEENSVLSAAFLLFCSCKTPWTAFCPLLCSQAS